MFSRGLEIVGCNFKKSGTFLGAFLGAFVTFGGVWRTLTGAAVPMMVAAFSSLRIRVTLRVGGGGGAEEGEGSGGDTGSMVAAIFFSGGLASGCGARDSTGGAGATLSSGAGGTSLGLGAWALGRLVTTTGGGGAGVVALSLVVFAVVAGLVESVFFRLRTTWGVGNTVPFKSRRILSATLSSILLEGPNFWPGK
jgi:hypothetical protein